MVALQNLQCTTTDDVYLSLKASDFLLHDLYHAYDDCLDHDGEDARSCMPALSLVLKKWYSIPSSHEFRCFVRQNRLSGSQTRRSSILTADALVL